MPQGARLTHPLVGIRSPPFTHHFQSMFKILVSPPGRKGNHAAHQPRRRSDPRGARCARSRACRPGSHVRAASARAGCVGPRRSSRYRGIDGRAHLAAPAEGERAGQRLGADADLAAGSGSRQGQGVRIAAHARGTARAPLPARLRARRAFENGGFARRSRTGTRQQGAQCGGFLDSSCEPVRAGCAPRGPDGSAGHRLSARSFRDRPVHRRGCDGTHGTHVADIIAGASTDGTHKGVAPGASLYAVKVCSSVSTACSGIALLQGMEFALDPEGDDDISDAVDVINMSLGSNYGQFEDDLSLASENAVRLGVVVVAAAGNASDHPYIVSSPSTAPGAISVAQTQVPSAVFHPLVINSPASIAGTYPNTVDVAWAKVDSGFTGNVAYVGRGCPAGSVAGQADADVYTADPSGNVALIDRGACNVSLKVDRAARAGAIGVLIGLVAPGDAISFSQGGGSMFVPTVVIIRSYSLLIQSTLGPSQSNAVNVTVHDSQLLIGSVVGSSARGPSYSYQTIKPEIGAPGASVSAIAGTGDREEAFGGTSGATPMIAGSAALLLEEFPRATPAEIKARLMNSGNTATLTGQSVAPGQLAPVTRIGAGEVRVDRAVSARTIAWVPQDESAAISFGAPSISQRSQFHKTVLVYNASNSKRRYSVAADFRDAVNQATGAARFHLPSKVDVGPRGLPSIDVTLTVDPSKLTTWTLDGGPKGGNAPLQTALEMDGDVTISDNSEAITLPWSILPHKAADVNADSHVELRGGTGTVRLSNDGTLPGRTEVFAWTGTSKKLPRGSLPRPGDNFAVIDLGQVGVRLVTSSLGPTVQFAINTLGNGSHPDYPAKFDIYIDANRDGTPDYVVFNLENGGFGATGQNVVEVFNLATGTGLIFFFADADLNSSNMIMTAPLTAVGVTSTSQFDFSVFAFDNYFTTKLTDSIENMTFSFAAPRFTGTGLPATGVPARGTATLTVNEVAGGATASPSQAGLLLLYRDAAGREAQAVRVGAHDNN